jgi:hypothetical protein
MAMRAINYLSHMGTSQGRGRRFSETLDEYLERLGQLPGPHAQAATRLSDLANRSCYAGAPGHLSRHEQKSIRADFAVLARALLQHQGSTGS